MEVGSIVFNVAPLARAKYCFEDIETLELELRDIMFNVFYAWIFTPDYGILCSSII
jgi:hypothetical protein